jgi:hypothetical protein
MKTNKENHISTQTLDTGHKLYRLEINFSWSFLSKVTASLHGTSREIDIIIELITLDPFLAPHGLWMRNILASSSP